MKRLLCGALAALMLLLCACVAEPTAESSTPDTTVATTTTTQTTVATTAPLPSVGYCIADPSMHVRSGPGPYEEVIGGLAYGEQVSIVGKEGDWYRITFKDDFAYVSAQYIADTLPSETTTAADTTTTDIATTTTTVATTASTAIAD